MAASVASALLSSGVVSALAARTPASVSRAASTERNASAAGVTELRASIEALRHRVSNLELELDKARSASAQLPTTVKAPFFVHDENDKPILWVLPNHTIEMFSTKGLVVIGPEAAGAFGISVRNEKNGPGVDIGIAKGGPGVVQVNREGKTTASLSEMGLITWNAAGKEISHLGADPTNKDRAVLTVRGTFSILDANFQTVIDGGALPDGRGAIRTWPNEDCRTFAGLRPPTCLMGVKP